MLYGPDKILDKYSIKPRRIITKSEWFKRFFLHEICHKPITIIFCRDLAKSCFETTNCEGCICGRNIYVLCTVAEILHYLTGPMFLYAEAVPSLL